MSLTKEEARELIRDAVRQAVLETLAMRPVPTHVTVAQAAEMLGRHRRTIERRFKRNKMGMIPYEAILAARSS